MSVVVDTKRNIARCEGSPQIVGTWTGRSVMPRLSEFHSALAAGKLPAIRTRGISTRPLPERNTSRRLCTQEPPSTFNYRRDTLLSSARDIYFYLFLSTFSQFSLLYAGSRLLYALCLRIIPPSEKRAQRSIAVNLFRSPDRTCLMTSHRKMLFPTRYRRHSRRGSLHSLNSHSI